MPGGTLWPRECSLGAPEGGDTTLFAGNDRPDVVHSSPRPCRRWPLHTVPQHIGRLLTVDHSVGRDRWSRSQALRCRSSDSAKSGVALTQHPNVSPLTARCFAVLLQTKTWTHGLMWRGRQGHGHPRARICGIRKAGPRRSETRTTMDLSGPRGSMGSRDLQPHGCNKRRPSTSPCLCAIGTVV